MSVEAITWAMKTRVSHSSAKFVLVILADCADRETLEAYPSVKYISEATEQDRKTVLANLKRLVEFGLIHDTGKRVGTTKGVVVYRLSGTENGTAKAYQKRDCYKGEAVPFFPESGTVFPDKQSRFSAEAVPKTGHGTVSEPSVNRQGTVCVSDQPLEEFGEAEQKASAESDIDPAIDARLGPLCRTLRTLNVDAAPHQLKHPDWLALLGRCSDSDIVGVAELAKAKKPGQRIALAYLAAMLSDVGTGIPPSRASPRTASKHEQRLAFGNEIFACIGGGHGRGGEAERVVDGEAWRVG